jgi:hypothetical protein
MPKEATIYTILSGNSGVTDLVSTRIYPIKAPQPIATPFIVYRQITQNTDYLLNGTIELAEVIIQITSCSTTLSNAIDISNAVFTAMNLAASGSGQYSIKKIFHENQQNGYYEDENLYYVRDDFSIITQITN